MAVQQLHLVGSHSARELISVERRSEVPSTQQVTGQTAQRWCESTNHRLACSRDHPQISQPNSFLESPFVLISFCRALGRRSRESSAPAEAL